MSYVICKNPGPDQKFTNPNPQSTCMCIITIKSQDRNQCVTIHAMSNFSSPDQKFRNTNPHTRACAQSQSDLRIK